MFEKASCLFLPQIWQWPSVQRCCSRLKDALALPLPSLPHPASLALSTTSFIIPHSQLGGFRVHHTRWLHFICQQIACEAHVNESTLVSLQRRARNTVMDIQQRLELPAERGQQEGTGAIRLCPNPQQERWDGDGGAAASPRLKM